MQRNVWEIQGNAENCMRNADRCTEMKRNVKKCREMQISSWPLWPSWHKGMSYLISLNPMHLKKIAHVGSFRILKKFAHSCIVKYWVIQYDSVSPSVKHVLGVQEWSYVVRSLKKLFSKIEFGPLLMLYLLSFYHIWYIFYTIILFIIILLLSLLSLSISIYDALPSSSGWFEVSVASSKLNLLTIRKSIYLRKDWKLINRRQRSDGWWWVQIWNWKWHSN